MRIVALLATLLCTCAVAQETALEERLPAPVVRALKAAAIPPEAVALVVQEADTIWSRASFNAGRPLNPASTIKLVTTFAALELLGPAHTWKTAALAVAPPKDGALAGDLFLRGSGDPKLTYEQFWLLLRELRARGLREIRGDLVLDRGAFAAAAHDPAAFDGKPLRPYNVGPDALLVNFKAVRLALLPAGAEIAVSPTPTLDNLDIDNRLQPAAGACGDWREGLRAELAPANGRHRLTLTGDYPVACGEQRWNIGLLTHDQYVLGLFRALWKELGGVFAGGVRAGAAPAAAQTLAFIESPPLAEIVRDINKFSNNVMARQLYLTLGGGGDGDTAIRAWLAARGLAMPELVLENGAGLSRRERISADSLARLLQAAWKSAVMPELMSSLPLLAVDGTLKKRPKENGAAGQAHVKTGSLEGVRTLAGYVLDRKGRRQIVVFFVNHPNAVAAQAAQDALLQWVYERAP